MPLATLKSEACPQISSYDFIVLCQLESFLPNTLVSWKGKDSTPSAHSSLLLQRNLVSGGGGKKKSRPKGFVVDIRSNEEFRQGHVPNSISLPHDVAFAADGSLAPSKAAVALSAVGGKILCVVGNKGDAAAAIVSEWHALWGGAAGAPLGSWYLRSGSMKVTPTLIKDLQSIG